MVGTKKELPTLLTSKKKLMFARALLKSSSITWPVKAGPSGAKRGFTRLRIILRLSGTSETVNCKRPLLEVILHLPLAEGGLIYRRQPGKSEKDERSCIEGIKDYNQNMGGTDLLDALRYHTRRNTKLSSGGISFFWILDNAVLSAYTLYECDFRDAGISGKKPTRRQFIIKVAEALLGHMQSKPSKKRRKSDENGSGKPVICGGAMPMTDKKRNCILCYHTLKKQLKTRVLCKG